MSQKKGIQFSDKRNKKISRGMRGNKNRLGIRCSIETRRKIGDFAKTRTSSKNPFYKHGKGYEPYSFQFVRQKERALARDNWTCQDCKIPQEELLQRLEVHHIDENKDNNELDNLITLCSKCHGIRHRREKCKARNRLKACLKNMEICMIALF